MDSEDNVAGKPLSIRELSHLVGTSYETCRRIVGGEPVVGRKLNRRLSEVLHLDPDEMWSIAVTEKVAKRFGDVLPNVMPDERLRSAWLLLTEPERLRVIRLAEALAAARRAEQGDGGGDPSG
jgi:hypothetical protein